MGETPAELLEMSDRKDGGVDGNKEKPDTAGDFAEKEDVAAETPQSGVIRERRTEHGVLDELRDQGSRGKVWIKI